MKIKLLIKKYSYQINYFLYNKHENRLYTLSITHFFKEKPVIKTSIINNYENVHSLLLNQKVFPEVIKYMTKDRYDFFNIIDVDENIFNLYGNDDKNNLLLEEILKIKSDVDKFTN